MDDKISVIVPVYNVEKYLRCCIDSILAQSYRNFELILVDDGSPDSCGQICDEYARRDERVIVVHKENGGVNDARNAGKERATGQYIAFIDSDDYISPEYLMELYRAVVRSGCDIAECRYIWVAEDDESCHDIHSDKPDQIVSPREWLTASADANGFTPETATWNKLYKATLLADFRFPGEIRSEEDYRTAYKIAYSADSIIEIYKVLYYYRQRQGSIAHSPYTKEKYLNFITGRQEKVAFFEQRHEWEILRHVKHRVCIDLIHIYIYISGRAAGLFRAGANRSL